MWIEEKATGSTSKPIFSLCCSKGKVKLPDPSPLPILMKQLLEDSEFMKNIRIYNASFSFLSFKAESDVNLSKNNVYTYRIRGMVQHRIGSLKPNDGCIPKCAQIYIYDGNQEELRQKYSSNLNPLTLIQIKSMLLYDCQNPFVQKFLHASQLLQKTPHSRIKIEIMSDKTKDKRVYNKPTSQEIAVLITNMDDFDVPNKPKGIVFEKNGNLQSIDVKNENLDPLLYVLIFPSGDQGWKHNTIRLNLSKDLNVHKNEETLDQDIEENLIENSDENEDQILLNEQNERPLENDAELFVDDNISHPLQNTKKNIKKTMQYVSALQYYSYQLCYRAGSYIHRFGRLFH